jgi:hypothetical protein
MLFAADIEIDKFGSAIFMFREHVNHICLLYTVWAKLHVLNQPDIHL